MASRGLFDEIPNLLTLFSKSRHVPRANSQQSDYAAAKEVEKFARGEDSHKGTAKTTSTPVAL